MKYYRLKEINDWEGETWNFYIPVEGNQKEIEKLKKHLVEDTYILDKKLYEEKDVDFLCENEDNCGYMNQHNKLAGKLKVPKKMNDDLLYKGGVKKFMENL